MVRKPGLTNRQLEVLNLVGKGLNNKEIAERLFIGEQTVKNHLYVAFRIIGVINRANAIAILHKQGLLGKEE